MRMRDDRRQTGQGTLEYGGMVLVVATVIGALAVTPVGEYVRDGLKSVVCRIAGYGPCPGTEIPLSLRRDEYYRPDKCMLNSSKTQYGASVSVIATVGGDIALVRKEMSDGTVQITAVQMGHVGIEGGVGADVQWGKVVNAGAEANIGVKLKGSLGKTYVFPDGGEADEWVDNIKKNNRIDAVKKTGLIGTIGGGIYDAFDDSEPPMEPRIERYKVGIEAYGEASASAGIGLEFGGTGRGRNGDDSGTGDSGDTGNGDTGNGDTGNGDTGNGDGTNDGGTNDGGTNDGGQNGDGGEDPGDPNNNAHNDETGHDEAAIDPEVGAGIRGEIGGDVVVEKDNKTGDVSTIFQYKVGGEAGATVGGRESINGVPIKAKGSIEGAMKVTRTSDGKIKSIEFQSGTTVNDKLTLTTTKLTVDSPQERRVASEWLGKAVRGAATQNPAGIPWVDATPTGAPSSDAGPMQRLLYREGNVTESKYRVSETKDQYGIEGKYGVKFGLEGHKVSANKELISSRYLGSPEDGERGYVPYDECST